MQPYHSHVEIEMNGIKQLTSKFSVDILIYHQSWIDWMEFAKVQLPAIKGNPKVPYAQFYFVVEMSRRCHATLSQEARVTSQRTAVNQTPYALEQR